MIKPGLKIILQTTLRHISRSGKKIMRRITTKIIQKSTLSLTQAHIPRFMLDQYIMVDMHSLMLHHMLRLTLVHGTKTIRRFGLKHISRLTLKIMKLNMIRRTLRSGRKTIPRPMLMYLTLPILNSG